MDSDSAITVVHLPVDAVRARHLAEMLGDEVEGVSATAAFDDGMQWWIELQFAVAPDAEAARAAIAAVVGAEAAAGMRFETIAARDWVAASLAGLKPVTAGRFVIHGAHDRGRIAPNCIAIEIEAALAFGTGHHATTRGCLLALERLHRVQQKRRPASPGSTSSPRVVPRRRGNTAPRPVLLDVGTGTGVLAIAAAKAWRRPVLASDIDRAAVETARDNARLNGATGCVTVIEATGVGAPRFRALGPYPLIVANILLEPLKRLAAPLAPLAAPGGRIILSGVLAEQADAALAAYRSQGLRLARRITLGGWVTLVLTRAGRAIGPAPLRS